jgi:hypothetical protein
MVNLRELRATLKVTASRRGALAIDRAVQVVDNLPVRPAYALPPTF